MITIDGVVSLLQRAGSDAEKATVRALALRSGLAWECGGCGWLNAITDDRCFGDCADTCTVRPVIHLGSAAAIHPDGDRSRTHTLAMCGADLGPIDDYHGPSSNYTAVDSTGYTRVTCAPCRKAFEARR